MRISTSLFAAKTSRIAAMLMLSACIMMLNACSKDESEVPSISGLMVVNAAPTIGTFNLYVNNTTGPYNKGALSMGSSIAPYFNIAPGSNNLKFTTASSIDALLSKSITVNAEKAYSFFLINDVPNLDGLLIEDNLSSTSTDKAFIRFINLSPDAAALDLTVTGGSTLIGDKSYKAASEFIAAEAKKYSFELKDKASGQVITTLKDITLTAGKMYTIAAMGMQHPGDLQHGARLQVLTNR